MFVLLYGEGFEAALPDVTRATMAFVVTADVCGEEPLHPAGEVTVLAGPEDEVEMVGHEAVAADAHGEAFAGEGHEIDEGLIVVVVVEDAGAAVAAVDDVVADVSG